MLKRWLPVFTAIAVAFSSALAQEARVDIGLLICGLGEGAEAESGGDAMTRETSKMLCVFRPSNNGPEEVYTGAFQISKIQLQAGRSGLAPLVFVRLVLALYASATDFGIISRWLLGQSG